MRRRPLAALAALAALLTACGAPTAGSGTASTDPPAAWDALDGDLVVFAAASLTDAFEDLAATFEHEHPGVQVVLNLAGSQRLATQILEGAPADVFASADERQLQVVVDAGRAGEPLAFARSRLAIAVEPGNPLDIAGLDDLADPAVKVVLAAEQVPAGRYAREVLGRADVDVRPVSLEVDVRSVLGKVALGEADAGIVYASDLVAAAGDVTGIPVPDDVDVVATYPVALVDGAPNPRAARAFVDLLRSQAGRRALAAHGFEPAT